MSITIKKNRFLPAVDRINTILKDIEELTISNVMLQGNGEGNLFIAGTDGIVFLTVQEDYEGEECQLNLPITKLLKIIKLCGEEISIEEVEDGEVEISSGNASWRLKVNASASIDFENPGCDWESVDKSFCDNMNKLYPMIDSNDSESAIFCDEEEMFVTNHKIVGTTKQPTKNVYIFERLIAKLYVQAFKEFESVQLGFSDDETMMICKTPTTMLFTKLVGLEEIGDNSITNIKPAQMISCLMLDRALKACDATKESEVILEMHPDEKYLKVIARNPKSEETVVKIEANSKNISGLTAITLDFDTAMKACNLISAPAKVLIISASKDTMVITDANNQHRAYFSILDYGEESE